MNIKCIINKIQQLIESEINSKKRKKMYFPSNGKENLLIFIDDLNLPVADKYGS